MRTPQKRVARDGSISWKVRFRQRGQQHSETFYDADHAREFAGVLDALGPAGALAWLDSQEPTDDAHPRQAPLTLDEWAARDIDALPNVTAGTRAEYHRMYRAQWSPRLGHLPLDAIDREAVSRAVRDLAERGKDGKPYGDKTVRNYHGLLSARFDSAMLNGHIPANPCRGIRLPRNTEHQTEEHRYLSHEEFRAILTATPEKSKALVMFLAGTGCRYSEMSALLVRDLDLERRTVRFRHAHKWARGDAPRVDGPTKTPRSRRTITLPRQLVDALSTHIDGLDAGDLVFRAPKGGRVWQGSFWSRIWDPTVTASGIAEPRPRPHDLRHTHAAWLIAAGRPLPEIQRRLGHESIQTTVDTYGNLRSDQMHGSADAAELAFRDDPPELPQ